MSYCANCGSKLNDGAKFCENCGAPVTDNSFEQKQEPAVETTARTYVPVTPYQSSSAGSNVVIERTKKNPPSGISIAALVTGILSILLYWVPVLGLVLGILGVAFGARGLVRAREQYENAGLAIAGLVCGIVGLILALITSIVLCAGASLISNRYRY